MNRQPHKMVKHTQTIRWLLLMNCLSVFDHFVGLALRVKLKVSFGKQTYRYITQLHSYQYLYPWCMFLQFFKIVVFFIWLPNSWPIFVATGVIILIIFFLNDFFAFFQFSHPCLFFDHVFFYLCLCREKLFVKRKRNLNNFNKFHFYKRHKKDPPFKNLDTFHQPIPALDPL